MIANPVEVPPEGLRLLRRIERKRPGLLRVEVPQAPEHPEPESLLRIMAMHFLKPGNFAFIRTSFLGVLPR